jgi:hypothetical protein
MIDERAVLPFGEVLASESTESVEGDGSATGPTTRTWLTGPNNDPDAGVDVDF